MTQDPKTILSQNRNLADEIRFAARYAAERDKVLEEHVSKDRKFRQTMDQLGRIGLEPSAWLNVVSVPTAFKIDKQSPNHALLSRVFEECELDPHKPRHWRLLINILVEHCFRGPGRSEKWDEGGLFDLLCDVREVQKTLTAPASKSKLAKILKKQFKPKYETANADTLRKQIARALDPVINPAALKDIDDLILARAQRAAVELGLPLEIGIEIQVATLERILVDEMRLTVEKRVQESGKILTEEIWEQYWAAAARKLAKESVAAMRSGTP